MIMLGSFDNNFPPFTQYPFQPNFGGPDPSGLEKKRKRSANEDNEMMEETRELIEHIRKQFFPQADYDRQLQESELDNNDDFYQIFYDPSSFEIKFNLDEVSGIDQYIELAKSLCERFLEKYPKMNTQQYAPSLHYTALLIAMKFLGNQSLQNKDFLNMFYQPSLTLERFNKMEIAFLNTIGWSI